MATEYRPGLEGVTAGISAISEVDPERNSLIYRGYDVHDLVDQCSFDEVAYLMLHGKLPNVQEFDEFNGRIRALREVPSDIWNVYRMFDHAAHPMDRLKAAVAVIAAKDPNASDMSEAASIARAERLYAQLPVLVVNGNRIMHDLQPRAPRADLDHNANFLYMLNGEEGSELFTKVLNVTQILYAEHGFNASTFSSRVTVSTLSDLYSGVVSAIGTLKGPLHGGANEAAMEMMIEIDDPSKAREWVLDALATKKKIMGFGHREYKRGDTRAIIVKKYVEELSEATGNRKWLEISNTLEEEMLKAKNLYPNVDFPVASAYYLMGIPIELYTPMFAMARVTGWSANIIEQLANNRIIRPHNEYNGPTGLEVKPISRRD